MEVKTKGWVWLSESELHRDRGGKRVRIRQGRVGGGEMLSLGMGRKWRIIRSSPRLGAKNAKSG